MGIDQVSVSVSLPIFQVAIFYLKPGSNSASRQQCFMILLRLMTSKGTWWANVSCPWVLKSVSCCWKSSGRFRTCWGDDLWKRCNAWGTILCERTGRFCLHRGRPLNFIPKKTVRYRRNLIMCIYIYIINYIYIYMCMYIIDNWYRLIQADIGFCLGTCCLCNWNEGRKVDFGCHGMANLSGQKGLKSKRLGNR